MKKLLIPFALALFFECEKKSDKSIEKPPLPLKVYESGDVKVKSYTFSGLEHFLKKNNDTTYVVNFWATWCQPCVEELPSFEKINATKSSEKVKVLLVSIDFPKMVESKLLPYISEHKLKSEVLLLNDPDANSWIPKVDSSWSGAIPATVIYKGNNRRFFEKSFTFGELEKEINSFK